MNEPPRYWPLQFREAVQEVFGRKSDGGFGKTVKLMIDRRVGHAFAVWSRRYPMNHKQDDYAWEVLTWVVRSTGRKAAAAPGVKHRLKYVHSAVYRELELIVNNEGVHEGFKRRGELVDVTAMLRELA